MVDTRRAEHDESQKGAWLSIGTYIVLTAVKLTVGWLSGSQAITADGLNNATDVIGSVAVLFGLKIARRPADDDHRYGHERAEGVASLVVATIMGLVSLEVGRSAVISLLNPDRQAPEAWSFWVAVGSGLILLGIYVYNLRLAKRCGSRALEAAAYDHRSDAMISAGAAVGILGGRLGWNWADPLASLVVAVMIAQTAWEIGKDAAHMLMDGYADTERMKALRALVNGVEGVSGVQSLRARNLGSSLAVEVTVLVSRQMSIVEAHEVANRVEDALTSQEDIQDVHVHVEPDSMAMAN